MSTTQIVQEESCAGIESAIMRYQDAVVAGSKEAVQDAYRAIVELYDPLAFVDVWHKKYRFLYDSGEDFTQDYLRIFCKSLLNWKPRHLRKESRYGGKGEFKNYFWGCLSHAYTNSLKSVSASKRSLAQRCPICEAWCGSLSTHVFESHQELLFDKLDASGYRVDELEDCPFCKSFKAPQEADGAEARAALRRHLATKHSSILFERFHELYPSHVTVASRPVSATMYDDSTGDEGFVYDSMSSAPTLGSLLALGLTPLQGAIVERILDGESDARRVMAQLQQEEGGAFRGLAETDFHDAMAGLQDAMHIVGLGG